MTGVTSVIANKSVLSNTVFPIDLTPVKAVLTSQATMVVGLTVTITGAAIVGTLSWTIVLLPGDLVPERRRPDRRRTGSCRS